MLNLGISIEQMVPLFKRIQQHILLCSSPQNWIGSCALEALWIGNVDEPSGVVGRLASFPAKAQYATALM